MKSNKKIAVSTVMILIVSVLLAACQGPTPTPVTLGGTTPLAVTAQLSPDPTTYGTCGGHISSMRATLTGSPSEVARVALVQGEMFWTNPDGTTAPGVVSGFLPPLTRQADGSYSATFDWSAGFDFNLPLSLHFNATAFDSSGAVLFKSDQATVSFNPCPGMTSLSPLVHFPVGVLPPSPYLIMTADLSPNPVYYEAGCDPHVSNVQVTISGTFASLVSSFDSGLSWTLPDGTPPAGVNGVPLTLTRQADGSYTGSYDWAAHSPGLTGPYALFFTATALNSTGIALNKQSVGAQFLPCPAPVLPTLPPFHLIKFEFDCLSPTSSLIIFTLDQAPTGNFQAMIGSQTWPCTLDTKNNKNLLICTGPGVKAGEKTQVSLADVLNPATLLLTQDTTNPTCATPTPTCKLTIAACNKAGFKILDTVKCVCHN